MLCSWNMYSSISKYSSNTFILGNTECVLPFFFFLKVYVKNKVGFFSLFFFLLVLLLLLLCFSVFWCVLFCFLNSQKDTIDLLSLQIRNILGETNI